MVEYGLPKPGARVRFPLPAPNGRAKISSFARLLFYNC